MPPPAPAPGRSAVSELEPRQALLERGDLVGVGALLPCEHRGGAVASQQRVLHVERRDQLYACGQITQTGEQSLAAIGAGGAAHAHDDRLGAGLDRGADQLTGALGARADGIGLQIGHQEQAAGRRDIDGGGGRVEQRKAGLDRPSGAVVHGGGVPGAGGRGTERCGGALAAVGQRHRHHLVTGPALQPAGA